MKSFLAKSTVMTLIVYILGIGIYQWGIPDFYIPVLPFMPILFYTVTNLVHVYLLSNAAKKEARFTSHYMAASFLKMFFYMALGIGYAFANREQAKIFLVNYLLLYIIYTTFEVIELSKVVRQKSR
jgi:phosphotransferase system  glucose/maltose/N-acetylglucosamine-specific IIC component